MPTVSPKLAGPEINRFMLQLQAQLKGDLAKSEAGMRMNMADYTGHQADTFVGLSEAARKRELQLKQGGWGAIRGGMQTFTDSQAQKRAERQASRGAGGTGPWGTIGGMVAGAAIAPFTGGASLLPTMALGTAIGGGIGGAVDLASAGNPAGAAQSVQSGLNSAMWVQNYAQFSPTTEQLNRQYPGGGQGNVWSDSNYFYGGGGGLQQGSFR